MFHSVAFASLARDAGYKLIERPYMRSLLLIGASAAALAGCSAAEAPPTEEIAKEVAPSKLLALGDGLKLNSDGATKIPFGSASDDVIGALESVMGQPLSQSVSPRCAPGPLELVEYPENFVLSFEDGALVGWSLSFTDAPSVMTPEGIRPGVLRDTVEERLTLVRSGMGPMGAEYSTLVGYTITTADSGNGQEVTLIDAGKVCYR